MTAYHQTMEGMKKQITHISPLSERAIWEQADPSRKTVSVAVAEQHFYFQPTQTHTGIHSI